MDLPLVGVKHQGTDLLTRFLLLTVLDLTVFAVDYVMRGTVVRLFCLRFGQTINCVLNWCRRLLNG